MALFEIEDLTFRYPEEDEETLKRVSLCIEEGSLTVLCGGTGSGKTTLLRHLKRELQPAGTRVGRILYNGKPLHEYSDGGIAEEIGMVFQHPDQQIVMDTIWHEMAFGLENRGYKPDVIRKRTAEIAQFFGLEPLLHQSVYHLSGGQKQLINLASVLVMQPRVLLLDEPTSQLDPLAAKEFLQLIKTLNEEFSMTIILSEHRLEDALPLADRVVLLEEGRVRYNGTAEEVVQEMFIRKDRVNLDYLPSVTKLCLTVSEGTPASIPFTVKEGRKVMNASVFSLYLEIAAIE